MFRKTVPKQWELTNQTLAFILQTLVGKQLLNSGQQTDLT